MLRDLHGLAISTSSAEAASAFERTILAYLKYRVDASQHLAHTLAADPEFGLAHCLSGARPCGLRHHPVLPLLCQ